MPSIKKKDEPTKPKSECMLCGTHCNGWQECVKVQKKRKRIAPGLAMYDTGKMGTPEHVAKVNAGLNAIKKQYPHLTRFEVIMLKVMREVYWRSDTSGGGPGPQYLAKLNLKYGGSHH